MHLCGGSRSRDLWYYCVWNTLWISCGFPNNLFQKRYNNITYHVICNLLRNPSLRDFPIHNKSNEYPDCLFWNTCVVINFGFGLVVTFPNTYSEGDTIIWWIIWSRTSQNCKPYNFPVHDTIQIACSRIHALW